MTRPLYAGFVLLVAALALTNAQEECTVSEWTDWGPCISEEETTEHTDELVSFPVVENAEPDKGSAIMNIMRKMKNALWDARAQCQANQTCPEFNVPPTLGYTPCVGGLAGEYPCQLIDLMAFMDFDALGYTKPLPNDIGRGSDIWGWTDPETGREYAIMGLAGATSFVDVTDPTHPFTVALMYSRTVPSMWRDMKVVDNTVYVVSEAQYHGMQVFDLLRLRDIHEFTIVHEDMEYKLVGASHNIVANEDTKYVYIVGARDPDYADMNCNGGLHMVNVQDRLNPKFAGCYSDDGYTHDAQCVIYIGPDDRYKNHEVCFNYNEDTLTIVDVNDKAMPVLISKTGYPNSAYTHQGWLTEDHRVLLLDDEIDEMQGKGYTKTLVWDVSDLQQPVIKNIHYSTNKAIDHNQYILGDLSFQSNYGAGLRIMHIDASKYSLRELAYFDVFPSHTRASFEGTWSNYPYFKSGTVVVSSIEYGLFVVRPDYDKIHQAIDSHVTFSTKMRSRDIIYADGGSLCPTLEEYDSCSA